MKFLLAGLVLPALGVGWLLSSDIPQTRAQARAGAPLADLHPGEGWLEVETAPPPDLRSRAWSDPADGCHLALFETNAGAGAELQIVATSLAGVLAEAGITLGPSEAQGTALRMPLHSPEMDGLAQVQIVEGPERTARMLACYWNHREPARCQKLCEILLPQEVIGSSADQAVPR